MIRKLLLPVLAAALLAGCATGYQYRGGNGDYYYGSPSTDYRYYGSPYGYGPYGYGYPYGSFGYGYYSYPRYYGRYYNPYYGHGHGDHDHDHDSDDGDGGQPDRPTPPWRDLGSIGQQPQQHVQPDVIRQRQRTGQRETQRPVFRPQPQTAPSVPRSSGGNDKAGSRISEMLRRSQQ